jgi:hypothetical protein
MKLENVEDIYELTPLQKGILFHSLYAPEFGLYLIQITYSMWGQLDRVAFERAWQQIIERHPALRTGFFWEDIDKPLQIVYKQVKTPLKYYDWRDLEPREQKKRLNSFLLSDRKQGFDLSDECLMRLFLIRLQDNYYEFIWTKHHLIMDGWSIPVVLGELVKIYTALCQGEPINLPSVRPFRDYLDWLEKQDFPQAELFWQQRLKDVRESTPLKNLEVENLSHQEERYDEEQIQLSTTTTAALQSLARQNQLTLNTLIQGAWAILLGHYSCREQIVYGCTVSGRPINLEGAESMVGVFINTLPIDVKLNPEQSLLSWLQEFQTKLVEAREYEYTPLTTIQNVSAIPRGVPLFESIVVFENQPITEYLQQWQGNIEVRDSRLFYKTNYPLTVVGYPSAALEIAISYDFRRFDRETIAAILEDFAILLNNMVHNPQVRLQDLQILTDKQQERLLRLTKAASFNFDLITCP